MIVTRRPELIPAQRRALVLERLRDRGAASIQDLAGAIGASASTIRRDLDQLQRAGAIARSHGGAVLQSTTRSTFEPEAAVAATLAREQKRAIGRAAAARLNPGESVIFDSGSTVQEAARAVVARNIPLTAVTNDLGTGQVLASGAQIRVVVLGGTLRPGSLTLIGEPGLGFLAGIHADVALIGTHAVSGRLLTETSLETAAMKRAMIEAGRQVILLADSSKFQPPAFCTICDIGQVQTLVTDAAADAERLTALREFGLDVVVAGA